MKMNLFTKISMIFAITSLITTIFSFFVTSDLIEEVLIQSYVDTQSKILDTIVENFELMTSSNMELINIYANHNYLREVLTNYEEKSNLELYYYYYELEELLKIFDANILSEQIMTMGKSGTIYSRNNRILRLTSEELLNHSITQISNDNPNQLFYLYDESGFYANQQSIIAVKQLMNQYTGLHIGTIYLHYDEKDFRTQYSTLDSEYSNIFIMDQNATIVSSGKAELIGTKEDTILSIALENERNNVEYTIYEENKEKHILFSRYLPIYNMYIINKISVNDTLHTFDAMKSNLFYFNIVIAIAGIFSMFLIIKRLLFPLSQIIRKIKRAKGGEFEKIDHLGASIEVLELKDAYNYMIDEINKRVGQVIEVENEKRLIEFATLQMQINPHFLYNTLATIKYLAWKNENKKVADTIEDLIDLLQNTVSNHNELITVDDEIKNLESYIRINEVRYGNAIQVRIFLDDECREVMIPKLILQPFVENAYFHAFQKKKSGRIVVECHEKEGILYFTIKDDGDGMEFLEEKMKDKKKSHFTGIGIDNVEQRIKILFGGEYGVTIESELNIGTKIIIKLPIQ